MPVLSVSPAIVLRTRSFGESDKIVSLLSQDFGKIAGIAKGAKRSRRRFVNTLEPFSLVTLRFQERSQTSLVFIQACDWLQVFKNLTTDLQRITVASYMVEITDELIREREENRLIFEHLKRALIFLEEEGPSPVFLLYFELQLLRLSGYQPLIDCCRRCGKKKPEARDLFQVREPGAGDSCRTLWFFSPRDGGLLCRSCLPFRKETFPLSVESIHALTRLQEDEKQFIALPILSPIAVKETRAALRHFIQFQINKVLKSAPFLDSFCTL